MGDKVSEVNLKYATEGNMQDKFNLIIEMRKILANGITCVYSETHLASVICLDNALTLWIKCAATEHPNFELTNLVDSAPKVKE